LKNFISRFDWRFSQFGVGQNSVAPNGMSKKVMKKFEEYEGYVDHSKIENKGHEIYRGICEKSNSRRELRSYYTKEQ